MGARAGLHRARTARPTRAAASSRACASRTTARAASAPTSARTRGRRRTACGSRAPRGPTSPPSSPLRRPRRRGVERAVSRHTESSPVGRGRPTRTAPPPAVARRRSRTRPTRSRDALRDTELLIADGHHRYETARVYAEELGGEGGHRYVLMCLVALQDPGLTVFPTHRLLTSLTDDQRVALREAITARLGDGRGRRRALEPEAAARRDDPRRLPRRAPQAPADADPARPRDRRRGPARDARALPPARHRRARGAAAQGRARDDRGRHLPPPRARLRARHRAGAQPRRERATSRPRSS